MRLHEAEVIGLTNQRGQRLMRLWRDVESVCGSFELEPGIHPPRFRPPPFPDATAWELLRTEFHPPAWALSDEDLAEG